MAIHLDFFHPNRLAVVVVRGTLTAEDVHQAIREFLASGALHYKKIVDMSHLNAPMEEKDIEAVAAMLRIRTEGAKRGPLAFVAGPGKPAENAGRFARMTADERPVKVFRSLHDARRWLEENFTA